MIKTGIDIVEIDRFSEMKNIDKFLKRVFTESERRYFSEKSNPYESIAGHFAAKEAFSKYMGTGLSGFSWLDIEVIHDDMAKPYLCFMGHKVPADLSISHSKSHAAAVVCGEALQAESKDNEKAEKYKSLLPGRDKNMHKGDCGRVFVLAGSKGMTGAAALCAESALRCGSGLVTVGTPDTEQPVLAVKLTEAMTLPLPSADGMLSPAANNEIVKYAEMNDVSAIGPGLGKAPELHRTVKAILDIEKPAVIDADGLNAVAEHIDILEQSHGDIVLTPHAGEMSRLCGRSIEEVQNFREEYTAELAKKTNATVLLKGNNTVIASPEGKIHINPTGNSGMATGGMGDVLTGVIASFMGQGLQGFEAAVLGAFIHGLAGDMAEAELGAFGMIAGDVRDRLPKAILKLRNF